MYRYNVCHFPRKNPSQFNKCLFDTPPPPCDKISSDSTPCSTVGVAVDLFTDIPIGHTAWLLPLSLYYTLMGTDYTDYMSLRDQAKIQTFKILY